MQRISDVCGGLLIGGAAALGVEWLKRANMNPGLLSLAFLVAGVLTLVLSTIWHNREKASRDDDTVIPCEGICRRSFRRGIMLPVRANWGRRGIATRYFCDACAQALADMYIRIEEEERGAEEES